MTYAISYPGTTNDRARIDRIYRSVQNNESNEVSRINLVNKSDQ